MQLAGDDKRIQALFHELKVEHRCVLPDFDHVWNRARISRAFPALSRGLSTSLIAAAMALAGIIAMFLLSGFVHGAAEIPELTIAQMSRPIEVNNPGPLFSKQKIGRRKRTQVARRLVNRDVIALSTWKSPTAILMEAPSDSELNSLPELNQAAKELLAFLPVDTKN